jgi:small subunit ribosomal protein S3
MAHKVNPKAYRRRRIGEWDTRGFYKTPAVTLEEDFKIRKFIYSKLGKLGIEKVEIERFSGKINIIISSARPGLIIGRGGEGIELLKKELEKKVMSKITKTSLRLEIREVKNPWLSASLTGQWVAAQIEKRVPARKVLKRAIAKVRENKEAKGVRIEVSGRLNGAEIARREWLAEGRLPRQTIRADIDYALEQAFTTYGVIGIKSWIYKGDKFE